MDPAFPLADMIAATGFDGLPPRTVAMTKRLVLDSVGVALAGAGSADCMVLVDLARGWGGRPEATVIGHDLRAPAPVAALVNGTMIQALDFDDTHDPSGAHTASCVLSAALAVAEMRRASGRDLVAAVTLGVDLSARLGAACEDKIGWTSTAVYGAFGAAAAAARVLGLDAAGVRHALGIVLSQVAGTTQTAVESPLSKHMQSGFAAKAGVLAALLAARGVTGVSEVFEGKFGFFRLYKGGRYDRRPLLADLGRRFQSDELSLKPYPCCRATHGVIEAVLDLARAYGLAANDVAAVRLTVPPVAYELVGREFRPGDNPVIAAQFSARYTVAAALLHGRVGLDEFRPAVIADPRVAELVGRVDVAVAAEAGDGFAPAVAEVWTADGVRHALTVRVLKGHPDRPLGDDEVQDKFMRCASAAPEPLTKDRARALGDAIAGLESVGDVSALTRYLGGR